MPRLLPRRALPEGDRGFSHDGSRRGVSPRAPGSGWGQGLAGSNPVIPTNQDGRDGRVHEPAAARRARQSRGFRLGADSELGRHSPRRSRKNLVRDLSLLKTHACRKILQMLLPDSAACPSESTDRVKADSSTQVGRCWSKPSNREDCGAGPGWVTSSSPACRRASSRCSTSRGRSIDRSTPRVKRCATASSLRRRRWPAWPPFSSGCFLTLPPRARPVDVSGWPDDWSPPTARGVFHVHSDRSDGSAAVRDIAAAAARAGLQFVIFTDHGDGTRAPDPPIYESGVLCIDAVEISTSGGHYIALGLPVSPYPLGG